MLKSSKYLLAVGDSFTDSNYKSKQYPDYDCSYDKWPDVLAQKMNISKVVNLGRSGTSNLYIFDTAIDHILKNSDKIEMVAIGTTEAWRFSPFNRWDINPLQIIQPSHLELPEYMQQSYKSIFAWVKFIWSNLISEKHGEETIRIFLRDYVRQVLRVQRLCKKLNIRLIITSLLGPINWWTINIIAKKYFDTTLPYDHKRVAAQMLLVEGAYDVDPTSFCGWPCFWEIGGWCCNTDPEWDKLKMEIGPDDGHPNAAGHIYIANKLYQHIQKNKL